MIITFKNGSKIHIKKANRGKFTEYCGGKVTSACIAKGKRSSDPKIRKRATFAANARSWKHLKGGILKAQGGTDLTYYGGSIPAVTISAPGPYAYQDKYTGDWYRIGYGGKKVPIDSRFNLSGARIVADPSLFDKLRLLRNKLDDPNHTYDFGNKMRNAALIATVAPMAGPLVEAATVAGDAAYAGYKALPWLTQQLIGKGAQAAFAADGLHNFFGPEGTRKTTRLINEGKYGDAALSAAGDMLNLSMAAPALEAGQALVKAAKPVADKTISFLNSPLTGKWTTIGNRQYRLRPNTLGSNGVPIESRRTPQLILLSAELMESINNYWKNLGKLKIRLGGNGKYASGILTKPGTAPTTFNGLNIKYIISPKGGNVTHKFYTDGGSEYILTKDGFARRIKSPHVNTLGADAGLHGWNKGATRFLDSNELGWSYHAWTDLNKPLGFSEKDGIISLVTKDNGKWRYVMRSELRPNAVKNKTIKDGIILSAYTTEPKIGKWILEYGTDPTGKINWFHPGSQVAFIEGLKLGGLLELMPKVGSIGKRKYN